MDLLNKLNDKYYITRKKPFKSNVTLLDEDIDACYKFAYDMTYGEKGAHRDHRSGGDQNREIGEIFCNTFQGKIAELAVYNYFSEAEIPISEPDMEVMGLNNWDSCDFVINGKKVAVKSTGSYGNLLLLETKDWTNEGLYIPNIETGESRYDYFILVRVKPNLKEIMKKKIYHLAMTYMMII